MTDVEFKEEYPAISLGISLNKWGDMSLQERIGAYQDKYTSFEWGSKQPDRMNPEYKGWFIETLLSGKYKQGQNRLLTVEDDGDHHCCLGVACDLIKPDGWGPVFSDSSSMYGEFRTKPFYYEDYQAVGTLPVSLRKVLGMDEVGTFMTIAEKDSNGNMFTEDGGTTFSRMESMSLAQLNDAGLTFKQIADVIRYFL